jgi:hypothetical protein
MVAPWAERTERVPAHIHNRLRFDEPLPPDDDRNLDIDRFGSTRVRGGIWTERLARRVELSDVPVYLLFTGLHGSGKSTELLRLAERLRQREARIYCRCTWTRRVSST